MWHRIVILFLLLLLLFEPARQLYWMLTVAEPHRSARVRPDHIVRFRESLKDFTPAERKAYVLEMAEQRRSRVVDA